MTKIFQFFGKPKWFSRNIVQKLVSIVLLLNFIQLAFSQQIIVKGKIFDEKGQTIIGATVTVKGTKSGAISDSKGEFQVQVNSLPVTIVISGVGYRYQEVEIYENESVTVTLTEDQNRLSEVVVVGYGTQKRADLTGSVSSVLVNKVQETKSTSFVNGLQGLASGLQVTQTSGAPGATSIVRIRGGNSINGGNEPLYVIDGFPIYNDNNSTDAGALFGAASVTSGTTNGNSPLSNLNPEDIESIEVLKDASATAIYGSRGANGVIIITTKRGSKGATKVTYDGSYGVQSISHKIKLLNAQQFATYRNDAQENSGLADTYTQDTINYFANHSTDWQDAAFRSAQVQDHALSFSGGNDKANYSASLGYLNQDGIVINTNFERYTGRLSLDSKITERINLGLNINESYSTSKVASTGTITSILYMPATVPVYDEAGDYTYQSPLEGTTANPVAYLKLATNQTIVQRTLGNAYGEFQIIKGLKAKVLFGADLINNRQYSYLPSALPAGNDYSGIAAVGSKFTTNWLNENTITYSKSINDIHNIDVLGGFTQQQSETKGSVNKAYGFANDNLTYNDLSSASSYTETSSYSDWTLQSYLGRLNYNYAHKYYITSSFRADGSSRLGSDHRWGFFPSVSLAWEADQESFLKNVFNKIAVNNLKVRLSYGRTGNTEIDPYQSLSLLSSSEYANGSGTTYTGFSPYQIPNPDLKWETTNQYDGGVDIALINQRIKLNADFYYKRTHDLLIDVYVPYTSGYASSLQNVGEVRNQGYDIALNTENFQGKFNWSTNITFSVNRNKVIDLGGEDYIVIGGGTNIGSIIKVGKPLGAFYGLKTDGLYRDASEIPSTSILGANTKVGDIKYVDVNGDGGITTAGDQTVLGDPQPKFIFGVTNSFTYSNIDLSVFVQGSYGNKINSYILRQLMTPNGYQNAIAGFSDHYTSENTDAKYQRPNQLINNSTNSDLYVFDGSYLRVKSITLGYTLPKKIVSRFKIDKVRFYIAGQNLFTLSKYPGFDPEVNSYSLNSSRQGTDLGAYPTARSITGGINVAF